MDTRKAVLWTIFSLSILLLWNNWENYSNKELLNKVSSISSEQIPKRIPNVPAVSGTLSVPNVNSSAAFESLEGSEKSEHITVTTDVLKLTFDTIGAQVIRAELLQYPDNSSRLKQPTILLDRSRELTYVVQSGIIGTDITNSFPTHQTPFCCVSQETQLVGNKLVVHFEAEKGGLKVGKTYTLHRNRYDIDVKHSLTNTSSVPVSPKLYLQLERDGNDPVYTSKFYRTFTGIAVYSKENRFEKISFSDVSKKKASYINQANNGWIAMVQHYFATAWIPEKGKMRSNEVLEVRPNLYAVRTIESFEKLLAGESIGADSHLWVGPQDQKAMSALVSGLELVVDYGWLTIISKPLFQTMIWIHSLLGNWGWSIVTLTILIKLAFYPLATASYRSTARMKQIAPRFQALKERYGSDRQKLNAAMIEMYREEKINPLGGCLPMLVQIPVFISLYWVLLASVEMRGAPWILWIDDLSTRDPFFILPTVMVATMFLQMKLNPTPTDPIQAKVMMIMPFVFGGIMFFFPSGLVLYWCVNNILSIIQQWNIVYRLRQETSMTQ